MVLPRRSAEGGIEARLLSSPRVIAAALILAGALCAFAWRATRRSPHDIASRVSGLHVPARARVVEFRDVASGAFGEGLDTRVVLELSPAETRRLAAQASARHDFGVTTGACADGVTQAGVSVRGECDAKSELGRAGAGLYHYERSGEAGYRLSVVDTARNRLVVLVVIQ